MQEDKEGRKKGEDLIENQRTRIISIAALQFQFCRLVHWNITDFIASDVREIAAGPNNGFDGLYTGFDHVTTTNGGKAKIEGIEFNFMQQLVWLPGQWV